MYYMLAKHSGNTDIKIQLWEIVAKKYITVL